ncbi:MAG: PhaM family polyhydroxyalkanoate granule multifunctional regulatory protein [Azonexus sp.]
MTNEQNNDPLNFMRNMWGNMGFSLPGMVAPTFDLDELDKRIKDMKAVEGWLRMNLSMLQMTIQGLEMQRTTVSTVQTMGKMASEAARSMSAAPEEAAPPVEEAASPLAGAMWPWQMMDQIREQMQQHAESVTAEAAPEQTAEKPASRRAKK